MDRSFIEAIVEKCQYQVPTEINGKIWYPEGWGRFRPEVPVTLRVGTLQGFVDYAKNNRDQLALNIMSAIVESPDSVALGGPIIFEPGANADSRRVCHIKADLALLRSTPLMGFGQYVDIETFVTNLLANFETTGDLEEVLELCSSIKDSSVRETNDDGYAQEVTAKKGVVLADRVKVKNPVKLTPHRTFPDITQPESPFILRFRGGTDYTGLTVALFEADNGKWKLEAIESIKFFLQTRMPEEVAILG